jgi:hypothetical protein
MDTSTLLAITGLSATVILGGFSIYLLFRTQKYPGRITFVKEACIGLFDAFVRNPTDLSILYQNKPVGENLVLLKGCFLNTGTKDISPEMIEKQISITLPEGYRWLAVTVVSTSSHVKSQAQIDNDREIKFDSGLFRRREHISFEAIAEVPDNRDTERSNTDPADALEAAMEFRHRITDTQKINKQEVQSNTQHRKYTILVWMSASQVSIMFIVLCMLGVLIWLKGMPADIHYLLNLDESQSVEVTLTPRLNGNVDVKGVDTDYKETIPIETFFNDRKWQPISVARKDFLESLIMICVVALLFLALLVFIVWQKRKDASLRKSLGIRSTALLATEDEDKA